MRNCWSHARVLSLEVEMVRNEAAEMGLESLVDSSAGVEGRFACLPCNKAFR